MSLLEQANKVLHEQMKYGDIGAAEVYVERKRTTFLRVERGQFQVGTISEEWGGAIRVLINQGLGFATFTAEELGSIAFKSAIDNARAAPPNPHAAIPEPSNLRSEFEGFDPKLDVLEPDDMVESLQIVQNVFDDKRVHGSLAMMGVSRHDIAIANTQGVECKSRATQLSIGLECFTKSGDLIGVGIGDARSPTA
ncbi:MAG: PmbA/TldA family metallopeptidase, partial [Candidatus Hodarchaeota archaeon]